MGDKVEGIGPNDPRWDSKVIADWCKPTNIGTCQENRYYEIVSKNKEKCLGAIEGNHEKTFRKKNHYDVQENLCNRLGVPDLGYTCFYRIIFKRGRSGNTFSVMCVFTHGAGCAVTKGAKINRLNRFIHRFDADIFAYGHVHDIITDTVPYLGIDRNGQIKHKVKSGAMTGCYFSTYTQGVSASYGEEKDYEPTVLGNAIFTIRPDEGFIDVERRLVV